MGGLLGNKSEDKPIPNQPKTQLTPQPEINQYRTRKTRAETPPNVRRQNIARLQQALLQSLIFDKPKQPLTQSAIVKVRKQFEDIQRHRPRNYTAELVDSELDHWTVTLEASSTSPFHSVPIEVDVRFQGDYPNTNPIFKMRKPKLFFHPNISQGLGNICTESVNKKSTNLSIRGKIDGIIHLLTIPNYQSPLNQEAANTYQRDEHAYNDKALSIFRAASKLK